MRFSGRSDGELADLAATGWRPALAVLVHRHGPALLAAFADEPDPAERTFDVLLRAARQLEDRPTDTPVGAWLFTLAGRPAPTHVPPTLDASLDRIWRDLDARWPGAERPRRRHPALRGAAICVGAVALGVAVPIVFLGLPATGDDGVLDPVRAQPLADEPVEEPTEEPEQLPAFEFPDVDDTPVSRTEEEGTPTEVEPASPVEPDLPLAPSEPTGSADDGSADGTDGAGASDGTGGTDGSADGGATDGSGGADGSAGTDGGSVPTDPGSEPTPEPDGAGGTDDGTGTGGAGIIGAIGTDA